MTIEYFKAGPIESETSRSEGQVLVGAMSMFRRYFGLTIKITLLLSLVVGAGLYIIDNALFNELLALFWKAREGIFVLTISIIAAGLIDSKVKALSAQVNLLNEESTKFTNGINITTGMMQDAEKSLGATMVSARNLLQSLKELSAAQLGNTADSSVSPPRRMATKLIFGKRKR